MSRYKKSFTSVPQQVQMLIARGLQVDEPQVAEQALRRIGYYRLSGYWHLYRQKTGSGETLSTFRPKTSFANVLKLYDFDEQLRATLLRGLAELEISLRFQIGHRLGRRATFGHREPHLLEDAFTTWKAGPHGTTESDHAEWLSEYRRQELRSQEAFVTHFRSRYGPHLPVWVSTEVMSMGTLSRLFNGLQENDRKLIAARFGCITTDGDGDSSTFSNWLNQIRHVRNLCAHHARVWNRTMDVTLSVPRSLPELTHLSQPSPRKIYGTIAVLRFALARVSPESVWWSEVCELLANFSTLTGVPESDLGCPQGWQTEVLWSSHYDAGPLSATVDAVDALDTFSKPEAAAALHKREKDSERKKLLRYLEAKNALIAHRIGPQRFYPAFQFSEGEVWAAVANVNEQLFLSFPEEERRLPAVNIAVQRWWTDSVGADQALTPLQRIADEATAILECARAWRPSTTPT